MCSELKMQTFAVTAFHLLERVAQYLSSTIPMQQKGANDNLVTEWLEFFSEGIYSLLLPLFVEVAGMMLNIYVGSLIAQRLRYCTANVQAVFLNTNHMWDISLKSHPSNIISGLNSA